MEQVEHVTAAGSLISVVCVGPAFPLDERRGKKQNAFCEMTSFFWLVHCIYISNITSMLSHK